MNPHVSYVAVANVLAALKPEELRAITDNPRQLKEFAASLVAKDIEDTYFVPIADKDLPGKFVETTAKWRKLASDLGYTGPVLWRVREGFTLKEHAPLAGPCYQSFAYLKDWSLKNDEPTKSAYVFFIPKLLEKSTGKTVEEQTALMVETRKRYGLPEHHLSNFGSAAELSGLILAHFKRTGERTPLKQYWARTGTFHGDGDRLYVGGFDESGLHCGDCDWDDRRVDDLGAFPLGVELG